MNTVICGHTRYSLFTERFQWKCTLEDTGFLSTMKEHINFEHCHTPMRKNAIQGFPQSAELDMVLALKKTQIIKDNEKKKIT